MIIYICILYIYMIIYAVFYGYSMFLPTFSLGCAPMYLSAKPAPHRPRSSPWQARPKQQEQLGDATYRFGRHKTKIEPAKSKKKQKYGQSAKCDHKGISSKKCMDSSVPRLNSAFHLQFPVSHSLSVSDVQ